MSSYRLHIKETVKLAYPVAIGQLGHIMMGVVDSLMVGRLGAENLAASSIANSVFFLIFVIGLGITFAISPLVAIDAGAGRSRESGSILKNGLVLNIIAAFILWFIIYFISDHMYLLKQPPAVAALASSYMKILSFSVFPLMVFQSYRQFIEGLSIMTPAMVITIGANFTNAFFNWVLIFGKLGMPSLGLNGAGYATTLTRVFMAFALMMYVLRSVRIKELGALSGRHPVNFETIKKILSIGLPSGFQYFFEVGAFSSAAVIVGWIGTKQLAAHQIALNLASVTYMTVTGISAAAAIRVGNAVGRGIKEEVRMAGFGAAFLGASIMAFFGICFIFLRFTLPGFYIDDPEVLSIASSLLIIAAIFQISDGTQAVALGMLRGLTDVKMPTVITFVAYWIFGLPVGYLLAFNFRMGVTGIWIGFIVGLSASAIMLTTRFHFKSSKSIQIEP